MVARYRASATDRNECIGFTVRRITVPDYKTNDMMRELANSFLHEFGYDPMVIDEIKYDDHEIRFHILHADGLWEWRTHERNA